MQSCREYEDLIWDAADKGRISDPLAKHLEICETCRESHRALVSAASGLRALRRVNAPDPRAAVRARIAAPTVGWLRIPAFAFAAACCILAIMFISMRWAKMPVRHISPIVVKHQLPKPEPKTVAVIPNYVEPAASPTQHTNAMEKKVIVARNHPKTKRAIARLHKHQHTALAKEETKTSTVREMPEQFRIQVTPVVIEHDPGPDASGTQRTPVYVVTQELQVTTWHSEDIDMQDSPM